MNKDGKIIAFILGATLLIIFGAAIMNGKSSLSPTNASVQVSDTQVLAEISASPQPFNAGDVPYGGGIANYTFSIKNTGNATAKLTRITTSCMCTQAAVKVGDKQTSFYGMSMSGIPNSNIDVDIPAGGEAQLLVKFDPAAHGLQGIAPFDRVVHLNFTSPLGYQDIQFNGRVVSN